jgi:hypothetical protein
MSWFGIAFSDVFIKKDRLFGFLLLFFSFYR